MFDQQHLESIAKAMTSMQWKAIRDCYIAVEEELSTGSSRTIIEAIEAIRAKVPSSDYHHEYMAKNRRRLGFKVPMGIDQSGKHYGFPYTNTIHSMMRSIVPQMPSDSTPLTEDQMNRFVANIYKKGRV